jgi:hypothetical protein
MSGTMAIEHRPHLPELDRVLKICDINEACGLKRPIVIGSTPIKLALPKEFGPYMRVTYDLDIVARNPDDLDVIAKKYGLKVEQRHIILRHVVKCGSFGEPTTLDVEAPLTELKLFGGADQMRLFWNQVDFFTKDTGIGLIPVEKRLMEPFKTMVVQGREVNAPSLSYLAATQLNPQAWTADRMKRLLYPLSFAYYEDPVSFKGEVLPRFLDIVREGEKKAKAIAHMVPKKYRNDFENYSEQMKKQGRLLETNLKSEFRVAKRIGMDEEQKNEFIKVLAGSFKSYSAGECTVV